MDRTIRRAFVAAATIAAAGGATFTTAVPAHADAANCLAQLSGHAAATPPQLVYPAQPAKIRLTTSAYADKACYQYGVSIGVSRTDLTSFQYSSASDNRWTGTGNYFFANFTLPPNQPGTWMVRQIAVKDSAGSVTIKQFTAATAPTKITVKRESFLTGTPHGSAITHSYVTAKLQAWSSVGTKANLANQRVELQVSRPGANRYSLFWAGTTDRYGSWRTAVIWNGVEGYDVRLAYYSPYQTIASDFHYLGRIAD